MNKLPTWKKSLFGIGVIFLGGLAVTVYNITIVQYQSEQITRNLDKIQKAGRDLEFVSRFDREIVLTNIGYMDSIVDKNQKNVDEDILKQHEQWNAWFNDNKDKYQAILQDPTDLADFEKTKKDVQKWKQTAEAMFQSIRNGASDEEYSKYDDVLDGTTDLLMSRNAKVIQKIRLNYENAVLESQRLNALGAKIQLTSFLLLGIFVFVIIGVLFMVRSIVNPIKRSVGSLNGPVNNALSSSNILDELSSELNHSTNEQNSAVQESVSAMEEIRGMTKRTLESIEDSRNSIKRVINNTTEGGKIMREMSDSMGEIRASNAKLNEIVEIINKISEKTTVINDIVFKTQLLSFNASIEAARAGEHGKGFAVVAEEVGHLAATSGEAAKEITSLLEDSQKNVTSIVNETESKTSRAQDVCSSSVKAFDGIAREVDTISNQIESIQTAAKEQEVGMTETSHALHRLGETAADNSSMASKVREIAGDLKKQSYSLSDIRNDANRVIAGGKLNAKVVPQNDNVSFDFTNVASSENAARESDEITADHESFKRVS